MTLYTIPLKKHKSWVAGLRWYSRDRGSSFQSDKRKVVNSACLTYRQTSSVGEDTEVISLLAGTVFQSSHVVSIGYAPVEDVPVKGKPLLRLALWYANENWPFSPVVIRLALDDNTHWLSQSFKGKLSLSSDQIVAAEASDEPFKKLVQRAGESVHVLDVTEPDQALALLHEWEKKAKVKSFATITSFHALTKSKLNEAKWFKPVATVSGLALLLITANSGYSWYQEYQAKLEEQERQERIRILEDVGPAPRPWTEQPELMPAYTRCLNLYEEQPKYSMGWETSQWRCNATQATREWSRGEYGSFSITPAASGFNPEDPNKLSNTLTFSGLPERGNAPIVNREAAAQILMDTARIHRFQARFNWGNENTRRVPRGDTFITEPLGHAKHRVQLIGEKIPPLSLLQNIAILPSSYLMSVENIQGRWTLTIEFYAEA